MTDVLTEVNSKSNTLDFSKQTIQRDVATLAEQFKILGVEDPLVIVVGKKTAAAFAKHERYLAEALGLSHVRWVTIPHYSAANSRVHGNSPERYRRLVMEALKSI